jgi:hypothetical protein
MMSKRNKGEFPMSKDRVSSLVKHEGIPIIFDLSLKGFYYWCRNRLKYLGFNPFITPYKYDHQIMIYARLIQGYIVTTDKDFLKCERAIILKVDKYEKMYVKMLKELHEKLS